MCFMQYNIYKVFLTRITVYIGITSDSFIMLVALIIFSVLMIWRHRKNIERIIRGEENKISWM